MDPLSPRSGPERGETSASGIALGGPSPVGVYAGAGKRGILLCGHSEGSSPSETGELPDSKLMTLLQHGLATRGLLCQLNVHPGWKVH